MGAITGGVGRDGRRPILEHFQVKWIRFAVENVSETKARADSTSVETEPAVYQPRPMAVESLQETENRDPAKKRPGWLSPPARRVA